MVKMVEAVSKQPLAKPDQLVIGRQEGQTRETLLLESAVGKIRNSFCRHFLVS